MGIFSIFKKEKDKGDPIILADSAFSNGDYSAALEGYQKVIEIYFSEKEPKTYTHLTKKIIECHKKLGNYASVIQLWPLQYSPGGYGTQEVYDLIKVLEASQNYDLAEKVYDKAGKALLRNKIEFLIRQRKIPQAYAAVNELLASVEESNPEIAKIWLTKAKLCMSLLKFEEANHFLNKILEKDMKNLEARKLKDFCLKSTKN